ncbi:hypothetical protein BJF78_09935 [Pseudonocardia sp. CNS-139]|nr:hypothetical protein BJF78_09935 [Pseudonocardia sp. CNS-139]
MAGLVTRPPARVVQQRGELVDERVEPGFAGHVGAARARDVDVLHVPHPARPPGHHDHPVGQQHRLVDVVRHEQGGDPLLHPDPRQLQVHPPPRHRVQGAERLVEQQDVRFEGERAGDRDALAHAAGELARPRVLEAGEADEREQVADPLPVHRAARHAERQRDVLPRRRPRQQRVLLERDAEPVRADEVGRAALLDGDRALGGLLQARDHAQHRRLAAARRAEQRDELAVPDREIEPFERAHGGAAAEREVLDDAGQGDCGSRPAGGVVGGADRGGGDARPCWHAGSSESGGSRPRYGATVAAVLRRRRPDVTAARRRRPCVGRAAAR